MRDDPDTCLVGIFWQNLLHDNVYFALIEVASCMISFYSSYNLQYIFFPTILSHWYKFAIIKSLITKLNNFRMTTIMLSQQSGRGILEDLRAGFLKAMLSRIIAIRYVVTTPYGIKGKPLLLSHHIGQLLVIPNNYSIARTRES